MEPARLLEIIEPLETLLVKKDFHSDGEPMVGDTFRMASFVRADGAKVDYTFEVLKDNDKGPYASDSDMLLKVDLHLNGETITLSPYENFSSNMPAPETAKDFVDRNIEPSLEEHL